MGHSPDGDEGLDVWADDPTNTGFRVEGLEYVVEEQVILRSPSAASPSASRGSVAGFDEFLEGRDEGIIVIPSVHATRFDTVVEVEGETVRMTERPEDLVFED